MVNPQYPTKKAADKGKGKEKDDKDVADENRACSAIRKLAPVSLTLVLASPVIPRRDGRVATCRTRSSAATSNWASSYVQRPAKGESHPKNYRVS